MIHKIVKSCLSAGCALAFFASALQAEVRVVEPSDPTPLPAFELTDHLGKVFDAKRYQGSWSLTLIGFTHCPDVCPFVLANLNAVLEEMSVRVRPDNLPKVYFIGVDPARDEAVLGDYVGHFNDRFIGATGSHEELEKFVEGIDGFYRLMNPDADGVYDVQHSASVIVTGPDGKIRAKLSPPFEAGPVAEYLTRIKITYARQTGN